MPDQEKLHFIQTEFRQLLAGLKADSKPNWGKMNAQQMVEHLSDFFKVSTNKIIFPLISAPDYLPKLKAFLLSDKAFKENTKAPDTIVPEEPADCRNQDIQAALVELNNEIDAFFQYFEQGPAEQTTHPVFGTLNFDEWILLHYKHLQHHAKQFGLIQIPQQ